MALLRPTRLLISEKSATYTIKWSNTLSWQVRVPANLPGQFSLSGQIFLHWAAATMKGLGEF